MKIEHSFKGNGQVCEQCKAPKFAHRGKRIREYQAPRNQRFFGIDGEGQTDRIAQTNGVGGFSGKHRYVMLCASDEKQKQYIVENQKGLTTRECLEFITSLPKYSAKYFAYSFGYDLTKILEDVDDNLLFRLVRPELRRVTRNQRKVLAPIYWPQDKPEYSFNWMNGRFSVRKLKSVTRVKNEKGERINHYQWHPSIVIHDVWKFFQGKFTAALEDWKVPDDVPKEERKRILDLMREMKDKRGDFDKLTREEIRNYCFEECRYMATLSRKLTEAHQKAKIPLRNYFGAGSSAEAMLLVMKVKDHIVQARRDNPIPHAVEYAQRCAFFGGRFENSRIGPVMGKIYCKDISSAYPYQLFTLPCLIHGTWRQTTQESELKNCRAALVRYTLEEPTIQRPWAPFPFRLDNGSIAFPETSGGGWIWKEEYQAGIKLFDNIRFQEAWLYECSCDCQPFKDIPRYYALRVSIGKEGPGIVIKLAVNSCYGKAAQTIGGEPGSFHSWMWAGMITAGCRAQILEVMAAHQDLDNMLMVATDGIATLEQITLPEPRDTGTNWIPCPEPDPKDIAETPHLYRKKGGQWLVNKPLGGWEEKILDNGLFLARPGIYFPLQPTKEDIKRIRARGVGRAAIWDNWSKIIASFQAGKEGIQIQDLSLFRGMKTCITRSGNPGEFKYRRSDQYGKWITRPVDMTFNPMPKREQEILEGGRLKLRRLKEEQSAPYNKGILSPEAMLLLQQAIEESEQPDGGDLTDAWQE